MTTRLAVVSGAGSGIGAACAERLAGAGFAVILVGRRSQALEATAAAIREATHPPASYACGPTCPNPTMSALSLSGSEPISSSST